MKPARKSVLVLAAVAAAVAGVCPAPALAGGAPVTKGSAMTNPTGDLLPLLAEPDLQWVIARLEPWTAGPSGGLAPFTVTEVLHGAALRAGAVLSVPIDRNADPQARVRDTANPWNRFALQPGQVLLLVCAGAPPVGTACTLRGVAAVGGRSGWTAETVRHSFALEAAVRLPPADRAQALPRLLTAALRSGEPQRMRHALALATEREALGRPASAAWLAAAMVDAALPLPARYDVAVAVAMRSTLFDPARAADRPNVELLSGWAGALVADDARERRLGYTRLIGAALLGDIAPRPADAALLRRALAGAVRTPAPARVRQALQSVLATDAADPADRERLEALLACWPT